MSDKTYWTLAGFCFIIVLAIVEPSLPADLMWIWKMLALCGVQIVTLTVAAILYEAFTALRLSNLSRKYQTRFDKAVTEGIEAQVAQMQKDAS